MSDNQNLTISKVDLKNLIARNVAFELNKKLKEVSEKYQLFEEKQKAKLSELTIENAKQSEEIQILTRRLKNSERISQNFYELSSDSFRTQARFLKSDNDCHRCKVLETALSRMEDERRELKRKNCSMSRFLDIVEAHEESLNKEKLIKQRYINELELKLNTYLGSFNDWKEDTVRRLVLLEDVEERADMCMAEIQDLKLRLFHVESKLKETLKYKDYQITVAEKQAIEDKIESLKEESLMYQKSPSKTNHLIHSLLSENMCTKQELNTAVLLGLDSNSTVKQAIEILLETSVYHNDSMLYERIVNRYGVKEFSKKDTSTPKTARVFQMNTRAALSVGHWNRRKEKKELKQTDIVLGVCETVNIEDNRECKVVEQLNQDYEACKKLDGAIVPTAEAIKLHTDIREKIQLMLQEEHVRIAQISVPAACKLQELINELQSAYNKVLIDSQDPSARDEVKQIEDSVSKVLGLFKRHGYSIDKGHDALTLVHDAFVKLVEMHDIKTQEFIVGDYTDSDDNSDVPDYNSD
jgi:sulfur transfer complex TusBCD TusB component (DsrH family)